MNIICSICRDPFTGADNETIYSTKCGHVFHYPCLLQWIESTKNCPHCRTKVTSENIIKLNLYFEESAGPRTGLEDNQHRNSQFELTMKNRELQQLKEISRVASEQSKGLRLQVKKLEEEVKVVKSKECNLLQENRNLRAELATERHENRRFGDMDAERVSLLDVIDLNDSDTELLLDIDANSQKNRTDQIPEVINLDDSRKENNEQLNYSHEVLELKNQMELKEVLLASAFTRISELEKENLSLKRNGAVGTGNGRFS